MDQLHHRQPHTSVPRIVGHEGGLHRHSPEIGLCSCRHARVKTRDVLQEILNSSIGVADILWYSCPDFEVIGMDIVLRYV